MSLFHPRILSRIIDRAPAALPDEYAEVIQDWAATIESGSIHRQSEIAIHGRFTQRLLIDVLGYEGYGNQPSWTLQAECPVGSGSVDVALGHFTDNSSSIVAPFELKPARMRDLDAVMSGRHKTPVQQAWEYAIDAPGAKWVLVSNYVELRLYAVGYGRAVYESWNLERLTEPEEFARFYTLLCAENLLGGYTLELLQESESVQEEITNALYADYRQIRTRLFQHLQEHHPDKSNRQILRLAQTILDRILFIAFAEDTGLLPSNTLERTFAQENPFAPAPTWHNFLGLFDAINVGRNLTIDGVRVEIPAYNGGLFAQDEEISELNVSNELCEMFKSIGRYEFQSEVSVEVLGHILEQSITDIEEITAAEDDEEFDRRLSRRRTEGVYYTPGFVTRYMIENTLGPVLQEKKEELGQESLPELTDADYESIKLIERGKTKGRLRYNENIAKHVEFWNQYKAALSEVKVLDPACGSGAFLIAAFDYLLQEGNQVNAEIANLVASQQELFRWDTHILQNNLFGVDINPESIEITKLSLWLKTANRREPLTYLDDTIRVGNSVIDSSELAPHDAFDWSTFGGGEFDVVVANPPYVSMLEISRNVSSDTKKYWKKRFAAATGAYDLFVLFMELSITLVRDVGYIGLITPNKYMASPYGVGIRNFMRETVQLCSILDLSADKVFQDPSVYPIVSILKRTASNNNPTDFAKRDVETGRVEILRECDASALDALPERMFSLVLSEHIDALLAILNRCSRLEEVAKVNATSTAAEAGQLAQHIIEYAPGATPLVNTGTIDRYMPLWGIRPLTSQRQEYTRPAIKLEEVELSKHRRDIYAAPKIIFSKLALRPEAFLDADGDYCSINTNCVYESDLPLEAIIGILNSNAMAFIYEQFFDSLRMGGRYLQFQAPQLRALPIPIVNPKAVKSIARTVAKIQETVNKINEIKREFIALLIADFGLDGTSRNLGSFDELTWQQFSAECQTRGATLTGDTREDWFQRFEAKVAEIAGLKASIVKLDEVVDELTFKAFDIDDELRATIDKVVPKK